MEFVDQKLVPTEFTIMSNDDKLIKEVIDSYNQNYGTNFEILEFIYDEVIFAKISVNNFELIDIFNLGYQFGTTAQFRRDRMLIDW